ncbi:N-6 DNA methylase [Vulcanibacillus modesticaldus]|uniref:Site-specific DNA-methyltransferase (adenine-specific) n=1 Tax=Vulcanibacillus modesticaldus TaxID=337097 RepID=A0A1D2YTV0_9BACI|nr:N-6 DNA methylase [Vulcanibacillus modesticaldus]
MEKTKIKPFVKWAGGKGQLIPIISNHLPIELEENKIKKYIEPFIGGGAVLFYFLQNYHFEEVIINDLNEDLINLYRTIKNDVNKLIDELRKLSDEYLPLDEESRKIYYYLIREKYNNNSLDMLRKSAYFIFLNKTCFNGLYRVNKKGEFNVPHGKYKNPLILDENNLISVSRALQNVQILSGDFEIIESYVDENTFVYFDPPYRPLNTTSSFTSYQKNDFDDDEQRRLAEFYHRLNDKGAKLMLSNSDPKNTDENDEFFELLYKSSEIKGSENINIIRVEASRSINSNGNGRGKIKELLILNY